MQRNVGQQWREDATLRGAFLAGVPLSVVPDPGFEPPLDGASEPGRGLEFGQQYRVVDAVKSNSSCHILAAQFHYFRFSVPAKDIYHDPVRRALQNDGWTITHDLLPLQIGKKYLSADLGAGGTNANTSSRRMKTYIALLRGINVGGKNILPMKELRHLLLEIGLLNVRTYIQSGNVAFEYEPTDEKRLVAKIQEVIQDSYGFSPSVFVLGQSDLIAALKNNPYPSRSIDPKNIHLYFLAKLPESNALEKAQALATNSEECSLVGDVFYLFAPEGVARSKLATSVEKALGVSATARNLRSVIKVLELAQKNLA